MRWTIFLALLFSSALFAAELSRLDKVKLLPYGGNDGDSFRVSAGGKILYLRLYYVDCAESKSYPKVYKRIREQQEYFGLTNDEQVLALGQQATNYTRRQLSRPFTVYTEYADARGAGKHKRIYAFIKTDKGKDLGMLLVENGLARVYGKAHRLANGTTSKRAWNALRTLERAAILNRSGGWKFARATRLAHTSKQFGQPQLPLKKRTPDDSPLDLNRATSRKLQEIPGVGPTTAKNIIAGRPYRTIEELDKQPGIGDKTIDKIRLYVKIFPQTKQP